MHERACTFADRILIFLLAALTFEFMSARMRVESFWAPWGHD